ncbi:MAG: hypothetical protein JNM63_08245, partial [Spirochaetia bacterium]|nr:hypothetical protein [Spirochaetia bacterium]
ADYKRVLQWCDKAKQLPPEFLAEYRSLTYEKLGNIEQAAEEVGKSAPESSRASRLTQIYSNAIVAALAKTNFSQALKWVDCLPGAKGDFAWETIVSCQRAKGEWVLAMSAASNLTAPGEKDRQLGNIYRDKKWYNKSLLFYQACFQAAGSAAPIRIVKTYLSNRPWVVPETGVLYGFTSVTTNIPLIYGLSISYLMHRWTFASVFGIRYQFGVTLQKNFSSGEVRASTASALRTQINNAYNRKDESVEKKSAIYQLYPDDVLGTNEACWTRQVSSTQPSGVEPVVMWYVTTDQDGVDTFHYFFLQGSDISYVCEWMRTDITEVTITCPNEEARRHFKREWPVWAGQFYSR